MCSNLDRDMLSPDPFLARFQGMLSQGPKVDRTLIDLVHVSNAAIYNNPSPSHVLSQLSRVPTHQSASQASSAIDNNALPSSLVLSSSGTRMLSSNQDVVIESIESDNRTQEHFALAIYPEYWMQHKQVAPCHD